jgi:RNA polymerase sigma-70 factor (ECF subfamily)
MKTNEIEILFRQHYNQMIQLARMMLYDDEESRDVVSEVFATLVKTDIMPRNVENYLMTSVRNRCRNLLEHKDVRAKFEQLYVTEMKQGSVEEEDDLSPMAVERKYEQVITYAKKQLTGQTLMVFEMRHLQGMKYQEIADQLCKVSDTLHRAPYQKIPASCFLTGFLFCLKSTPPILSESSISKTDSSLLLTRYFFVITMKNQ